MIQEHIVDSPEKCYAGLVLKGEVGRGEFGIAYELKPGAQNAAIADALSASGKYVLKQVTILNPKGRVDFRKEVQIASTLGELGVGPNIYKSWFCNYGPSQPSHQLYGYYVMDRLSAVWKGQYGHTLGSKKHQEQLITAIEGMVQRGYLHQDCHVGNVGFVDGNVKLFDFGLTVEMPRRAREACVVNPTIQNLLIASQLSIVIEQYDRKDMFSEKNQIHRKIQQLVGPVPKRKTQQTHKIVTFEEQKRKIRKASHHVSTTYGSCCVVVKTSILMTYLYQIIESYSVFADYSTEYFEENTENVFPGLVYALIYDIRLGKVHLESMEEWFNTKLGSFSKTKTVERSAATGAIILPKPVSTNVRTRETSEGKGKGGGKGGKGGTRKRDNNTKTRRR